MTVGGNGTVRIALGLDAGGFHSAVQMSRRGIVQVQYDIRSRN